MKSALIAASVAAVVAATLSAAPAALTRDESAQARSLKSRVYTLEQKVKNLTARTSRALSVAASARKAAAVASGRKPYVVDRDGDSRLVAAGSAAEFSAKCQSGETAISATWTGGSAKDLYVWGTDTGNGAAAVLVNTSGIDMRMQLNAVCLRLTTTN